MLWLPLRYQHRKMTTTTPRNMVVCWECFGTGTIPSPTRKRRGVKPCRKIQWVGSLVGRARYKQTNKPAADDDGRTDGLGLCYAAEIQANKQTNRPIMGLTFILLCGCSMGAFTICRSCCAVSYLGEAVIQKGSRLLHCIILPIYLVHNSFIFRKCALAMRHSTYIAYT